MYGKRHLVNDPLKYWVCMHRKRSPKMIPLYRMHRKLSLDATHPSAPENEALCMPATLRHNEGPAILPAIL